MAKRKDAEEPEFIYSPTGMYDLRRQEKDRHYIWASKTWRMSGVDKYRALGYRIEKYEANGVTPVGVDAEHDAILGQEIERNNCLLMSCPMALKLRREQYGDDGKTGQRHADVVEKRLRGSNQREILGNLSRSMGPTGPLFGVINETPDRVVEVER